MFTFCVISLADHAIHASFETFEAAREGAEELRASGECPDGIIWEWDNVEDYPALRRQLNPDDWRQWT